MVVMVVAFLKIIKTIHTCIYTYITPSRENSLVLVLTGFFPNAYKHTLNLFVLQKWDTHRHNHRICCFLLSIHYLWTSVRVGKFWLKKKNLLWAKISSLTTRTCFFLNCFSGVFFCLEYSSYTMLEWINQ